MVQQTYNQDQPIISQYSSATVIGLGATGYSVVRYLRARGLSVSVLDSRSQPHLAKKLEKEFPEVDCYFGEFDNTHLKEGGLIVASPGVSLREPILREAKTNGCLIVGDVELFLQENEKPVIAITGSNGKSTVTTLVGNMCREAEMQPWVAGNIGQPVLDGLTDESLYDVAVLELSSFQLETTLNVPADAAAILNISADHMDRYDSMGDYVLSKARIMRGAKRAILPLHDEQLKQISNVSDVLYFDLDEPASKSIFGIKRQSNNRWLMQGEEKLIKLKDIPLVGLHNVKNVLSAFALVDFLDLPLAKKVNAVKSFSGLKHRMQTVAQHNEITWVNDSKATNIGATSTALKNLEKSIVWIAGGEGKGADFGELKKAINANVKHLVVLGVDGPKIAAALDGLLPVEQAKSMQDAVAKAAEKASEGGYVLLSPACASFDMYQNFEQRGEDFIRVVKQYISGGLNE